MYKLVVSLLFSLSLLACASTRAVCPPVKAEGVANFSWTYSKKIVQWNAILGEMDCTRMEWLHQDIEKWRFTLQEVQKAFKPMQTAEAKNWHHLRNRAFKWYVEVYLTRVEECRPGKKIGHEIVGPVRK